VLERGRSEKLGAALSSSFGFGGMSCVLAFSAADRAAPVTAAPKHRVAVVATTVLDGSATPATLDPERSRRFDAGSTLAAAGSAALLSAAGGETGLVLGTAFGNVERTMAFLARGKQRGPRHVPPAEFPHLVPSGPAGNASVYAGLSGPVFAVSDLAQSGEAAFAAACDLLELGVAGEVVAGAIAPRDAIVERVLGPLLEPAGFNAASRGEGAGFTLLRGFSGSAPAGVSAEVLLRVTDALTSSGLDAVPAPDSRRRSAVVLGVAGAELRQALAGSAWGSVPLVDLASQYGYHEALGSIGLAVAAQRIMAAEHERVLVLSGSGEVFSATLLGYLAATKE
jgi:hypothetical protein